MKLLLALLLLPTASWSAEVTSTRVTTYDFQAQDAQGNRISDHNRFDTALIACLNNPQCAFVAGGKYRIGRTSAPVLGVAAVSWGVPTKNTDGTNLTDLAGYKVCRGTSQTAINICQTVTTTSYTFTGLASGTHYFTVYVLNSAAQESDPSGIASKVIP